MGHLSDHDLERYHLGMVTDEAELATLEEHYLGCPECARRAEAAAQYVDDVRLALIRGGTDREFPEQADDEWRRPRRSVSGNQVRRNLD